ncbi:thiosulfate oxidation carrier complex protein SoxZ [Ferrovibrio sp.]|uniref:thiosulfate oxidation carrier complex protein SoxZ n=1 Tax=Ferrovibrio sp. TaxID=1917215 RepID=UPI001B4658B0|nr:thiosulfate oxidation carrier complex protein SoxZ [Ferrovibrio sp.]MBP7063313.1 thiosulfate oxidation carrier complex protein SoxZ [Ferrovibrio sp.]
MARALINFPRNARKGEVIEIKTMISHVMETGYRPGPDGTVAPRDIIRRFTCHYAGEEVFRADLYQAIAANPFIAFTTIATQSGTLSFTWEGDNGFRQSETMAIIVA